MSLKTTIFNAKTYVFYFKKISFAITFLMLLSSLTKISAQKKALTCLSNFEYKKAYDGLVKKNTINAHYGLAVLHSTSNSGYFNLYKAYQQINAAIELFNKSKNAHKAQYQYIFDRRDFITHLAFQNAIACGNYEAFEEFLSNYRRNAYTDSAVAYRNSLAYYYALDQNTISSYQKYMNNYPLAAQFDEAKLNKEKLVFKIHNDVSTVKAYEDYLKYNPNGYFRKQAEENIYTLSVSANNIKAYETFIKNYPHNSYVNQAWITLFNLFNKDGKVETIENFIQRYPNYPQIGNLKKEVILAKTIFLPFSKKGKWGYMDTLGNQLIAPQYEYAYDFENGVAIVEQDSKQNFITKNNTTIAATWFNEVNTFSNGYAIVSVNNKEGAINKNGEWVITPTYNYLSDYECNVFKAQNSEGRYGCLNEQGTVTVDFIFNELEDIQDACATSLTKEETNHKEKALQQITYKLNEANICDVEISTMYENSSFIKLKKKSKIAYYNPNTNTFLWKENGF